MESLLDETRLFFCSASVFNKVTRTTTEEENEEENWWKINCRKTLRNICYIWCQSDVLLSKYDAAHTRGIYGMDVTKSKIYDNGNGGVDSRQ